MIGDKIIKIMSEIEAIEKKEIDEEKNYKFAKSEDIIAMIKPLLVKHKVIILPVEVTSFVPQGNKVFITMKYQFVDVEDEKKDSIEVQIPGSGYDEKGRAVYAALTGAFRYAMQEVFSIPVVDEIKNNTAEAEEKNKDNKSSPNEVVNENASNDITEESLDSIDLDELFNNKIA